MAAEKNRHDIDPYESGFFDDLTERVFKDYEPPKLKKTLDESEDDETTDGNESQRAA